MKDFTYQIITFYDTAPRDDDVRCCRHAHGFGIHVTGVEPEPSPRKIARNVKISEAEIVRVKSWTASPSSTLSATDFTSRDSSSSSSSSCRIDAVLLAYF